MEGFTLGVVIGAAVSTAILVLAYRVVHWWLTADDKLCDEFIELFEEDPRF